MTDLNDSSTKMAQGRVRTRRSGVRFLLIILIPVLAALGGGLLIIILNPTLLDRAMTLFPTGMDNVSGNSTTASVESVIEPVDFGTVQDEPILIQPEPVLAKPVEPDPEILELKELYRQLDERIAFQAADNKTLSGQISDITALQETLHGRLAEINTRLNMTETVDMATIDNMIKRQEHLENRQLEHNHFIATNIDAVVGSLSLVKQKTADLEDMISDLSSDLYLLSRYGYGNDSRTGQARSFSSSVTQSSADLHTDTTSPTIRRGDYRVGDWIQGYGEVLSIHRTVEGDYLTTENGEVFATAVPDEE